MLFAAAYLLLWPPDYASGQQRFFLLAFLVVSVSVYHIVYLQFRQQTLAMVAWKIRISGRSDAKPSTKQLILRSSVVLLSIPLAGIGYLWAFVDPDRRFAQDRIAGTVLSPAIKFQ